MSAKNKDKRVAIRLTFHDHENWTNFSLRSSSGTLTEFIRESVEENIILIDKVKRLKGRKKGIYEGRSLIIDGQRYVLCSADKYQNFADYFKELAIGKRCRELEPGTTKADRLFREGGDLIA